MKVSKKLPLLYHNLEWEDVRYVEPESYSVCLVMVEGGIHPLLRQFLKNKFAKGTYPVTHFIEMYPINRS